MKTIILSLAAFAASLSVSAQQLDTSMNRYKAVAIRNLKQYKGLHYAACGAELLGGLILYAGVKDSKTDAFSQYTINFDKKVGIGFGIMAVGVVAHFILPTKLRSVKQYISGNGISIPLN